MNHHKTMSIWLAAGGLLALLASGGCGSSSQPTKSIRTGEPSSAQPATFTSAPGMLPVQPASATTVESLQPYEQWTESHAAADALGRIGPPAVPQLVQALRSDDPFVRWQSAQVLARMGSDARDAVPDLVRLLDDPNEQIRKTAARTLGRIGPDAAPAVPALMRTLLQPAPVAPQ